MKVTEKDDIARCAHTAVRTKRISRHSRVALALAMPIIAPPIAIVVVLTIRASQEPPLCDGQRPANAVETERVHDDNDDDDDDDDGGGGQKIR